MSDSASSEDNGQSLAVIGAILGGTLGVGVVAICVTAIVVNISKKAKHKRQLLNRTRNDPEFGIATNGDASRALAAAALDGGSASNAVRMTATATEDTPPVKKEGVSTMNADTAGDAAAASTAAT